MTRPATRIPNVGAIAASVVPVRVANPRGVEEPIDVVLRRQQKRSAEIGSLLSTSRPCAWNS